MMRIMRFNINATNAIIQSTIHANALANISPKPKNFGGAENAGRENDGREIDGPICRA